MTVIAVFAQGEMGSGVGRRLAERGAQVMTCLEGRSEASRKRAQAAGMKDAPFEALAEADYFLSILPPSEAPSLARRVASLKRRASSKPIYADCNAVSPETAVEISKAFTESPFRFVDAGIIGGAPRPDYDGPHIYASGPAAGDFGALKTFGLDINVLEKPVGAASAMKLSYAGITKGMTAIGAIMILAAYRADAGEALKRELAISQPQMSVWLRRQCLSMIPKAYRWDAEMDEIAEFQRAETPEARVYEAIAEVYTRLAADEKGDKAETDLLRQFFS